MAKMRREISYYEAQPGMFEPAPTRADARKAEQYRAARAERIRNMLLAVLAGACLAAYLIANYIAFGGGLPRI